jgi:hypothetical protein
VKPALAPFALLVVVWISASLTLGMGPRSYTSVGGGWRVFEALPNQGCTPVPGYLTWQEVQERVQIDAKDYAVVIVAPGQEAPNVVDGCFQDYPQQLYTPYPARRLR